MAGKGLPIICGVLTAGVTCTLLVLINGTGSKSHAATNDSAKTDATGSGATSAAVANDSGKKPDQPAAASAGSTAEVASNNTPPTADPASSAAAAPAGGVTLSFDLGPKDDPAFKPTIAVDGKQFETTDLVLPPTPDKTSHIIITAPGYLPYEKEMVIKEDQKIFATLQKDPTAPKAGAATTTTHAPANNNNNNNNTQQTPPHNNPTTTHKPKVIL
jgi:hypothetical protein